MDNNQGRPGFWKDMSTLVEFLNVRRINIFRFHLSLIEFLVIITFMNFIGSCFH